MINNKDIIEIELILKDANSKEVLDTTNKDLAKESNLNLKQEYKPLNYVFGAGELLKAVEENIKDLEVSKTKTFVLKKEQAFKDKDPNKIELISINEFKKEKINPQVGLFVNVGNRSGKIISVSGGRVKVDFNPIYAGRDLEYTITINTIISKDQEKIPLLLDKAFYFMPKEQLKLEIKEKDIELEVPLGLPQEMDYFKQLFSKLVFESTNYENVKFVQKFNKDEKGE
jgi:FKBP-type peptidyl-prolyl cis-trans isomerase 2